MEESKLEWLKARAGVVSDHPEKLVSNWEAPEAGEVNQETIYFVQVGEIDVGRFTNLFKALRLMQAFPGSVLRPWTSAQEERAREKQSSRFGFTIASPTAPFVKEPGGGKAQFSVNMKSPNRSNNEGRIPFQTFINVPDGTSAIG